MFLKFIVVQVLDAIKPKFERMGRVDGSERCKRAEFLFEFLCGYSVWGDFVHVSVNDVDPIEDRCVGFVWLS
jgi:hypothetical protein